ncbi:unnamed protein product [Alopecurus aequalis]
MDALKFHNILQTVCAYVPEPPFPVAPSSRYNGSGYVVNHTAGAGDDGSSYASIRYLATRCSPAFLSAMSESGEDHISALPDDLRLNIVSRLPLKDAGRTSVLSKGWRGIWQGNSLIFRDDQLTRTGWRLSFDDSSLVESVSSFLESYQGRFGWIHLLFDYVKYHGEVAKWLQLFADKGVETLVLINKAVLLPKLPATILSCSNLRRLYLGLWQFPDTTGLTCNRAVFPFLEELGICHTIMQDHDFEYLLACSPCLKIINFVQSHSSPSRVCITSHSLSKVVLWLSTVEELTVVTATRLQRLILEPGTTAISGNTNLIIGYVPHLDVLGYLHMANPPTFVTTIENVRPDGMVPSVRVIALKVCFGVAREVRRLMGFLRCFPHVEALHVRVLTTSLLDEVNGELSSTFWQDVAPPECIESHVAKVVIDQTTMEGNELQFIKLLLERAEVLRQMVLVLPSATSEMKMQAATDNMAKQRANGVSCSEVRMLQCLRGPSSSGAPDISASDPFPVPKGRTVFWSPGVGAKNLRWLDTIVEEENK